MDNIEALQRAADDLRTALQGNPYYCANHGSAEYPHLTEETYCHRMGNCSNFEPNPTGIKSIRQLSRKLVRSGRLNEKYIEMLTIVM